MYHLREGSPFRAWLRSSQLSEPAASPSEPAGELRLLSNVSKKLLQDWGKHEGLGACQEFLTQ